MLFTPEGQLLSYRSKSGSCSIDIWPHIDSLWLSIPDHETKADQLVVNGAQEIHRCVKNSSQLYVQHSSSIQSVSFS